MTRDEFKNLSIDLRELARRVPLQWGAIQNNQYDSMINMFNCHSYSTLENVIRSLPEQIKQYYRRRWYIWKCAQCDEWLFCENENVVPNPNRKDQGWDIEINGCIRFDVKGTVVPKDMRGDVNEIIKNPDHMIRFYYEKQSRGVRFCHQNRLFIVHHSYVNGDRELYLRCAWGTKRNAYHSFCSNLKKIKLFSYEGCEVGVIFILEKEYRKAEFVIPWLK